MRCEDALKEVVEARYEGREPPKEAVEALARAECREVLEKSERLDALMKLSERHEPGPGFDTRFFAKLEEEKHRKSSPWLAPLVGTLAVGVAAAVAVIVLPGEMPVTSSSGDTELAMIRELDLLEQLEVVEQLDEVETYDLLAAVDMDTLDSLIDEERP